MRHFMKLSLILVLLLATTLAVSCGNDKTKTETSAESTTANAVTTTATEATSANTSGSTATTTEKPVTVTTAETTPDVNVTTTSAIIDKPVCSEHTLSANGSYCTVCYTVIQLDSKEYKDMVYFNCDSETLTKAYQIAFDDITGNIKSYKAGVLTESVPCIMAGGDYNTPWTRDTAINVWNSIALMRPDVAKNTLLSVLKKSGGKNYLIDGEYWDAIIWAIGAEQYINVTHDTEFTEIAQNAIKNSLSNYERTEYDRTDGLFRGGAVYGDGIAAYPDKYAIGAPNSNIMGWLGNPNNTISSTLPGKGLPMKALSTNCVYYQAYVILARLNAKLGLDTTEPLQKAEAMKEAINKAFWNEEKGSYDYLAYDCDYQEAIGLAFVLMFGIADERQAALVLQNTQVTENGIGIVWPSFDRYLEVGEYGRHAGVVWPHGQAFWAQACAQYNYYYGYEYELFLMAQKAVRDNQFYEIYHPDTGSPYGGIQEVGSSTMTMHTSCRHQTWSATGYLSLVYYELLGANISENEVTFTPYLPEGVNEATISNFKVGSATMDIVIIRGGSTASVATIDTTVEGNHRIVLSVQ